MPRFVKNLFLLVLSAGFLLIVGSSVLYYDLDRFARLPSGTDASVKIIEIRPGSPVRETIKLLHGAGLITSRVRFKLLIRFKGLEKRIKAGEYALSANMSPQAILDCLAGGHVRLYRMTVPEGYTLARIAALAESDHMVSADEFLRTCRDTRFLDELGIHADSAEGYLFPDTYLFARDVTPMTLIRAMVNRFHAVFIPEWNERAREMGFSVHQIVTLASIIEKETGVDEERPIVSSVFHNRLKKGMRLESDPTVIYGVEDYSGRLTRKHLNTHTPYNTYRISGLPPGPIASPGRRSIEAALYPAETPYYFFVSRKDRTHQFSATLSEHNRAVCKFQLGQP